uniref:Glucan endo-1,3-beta-D-glucosidase n=1 Tax=Oryza rufipogon TaxID=4529 RepID=A0A0E0PZ20_ORYRU
MLLSLRIGRVWLYNADPTTLRVFTNTGVELVVGVPDECLAAVLTPFGVASWVRSVIKPALSATKIVVLTIGNELGLNKQVAFTTVHDLGVLATSYPPSSAYFRKDLLPLLCPILDFHARTGSLFLDPTGIEFEYALLKPTYANVFVIVQPSTDVCKLQAIVTNRGTDLTAIVAREGSGYYILAILRRSRRECRGGRSHHHRRPPPREWP